MNIIIRKLLGVVGCLVVIILGWLILPIIASIVILKFTHEMLEVALNMVLNKEKID